MLRAAKRFGRSFEVTLHLERLDEPLHWRKPRRVFVCSMADLFHEQVPDDFIARVWDRMASATADCGKAGRHEHEEECWCGPSHTFQILTKRPVRMAQFLDNDWDSGLNRATEYWGGDTCLSIAREVGAWPLPNVWLGTSIENDRWVGRANALRDTPAAVRFISAEPLLGPLPSLDLTGIDWLIVGGESGPGHRPMDPEWALDLIDRAHDAGRVRVRQAGLGAAPRDAGQPARLGLRAARVPPMNPGAWHMDPARDVIVPFLLDAWKARNRDRWARGPWIAEDRRLLAAMRRVWHGLRER